MLFSAFVAFRFVRAVDSESNDRFDPMVGRQRLDIVCGRQICESTGESSGHLHSTENQHESGCLVAHLELFWLLEQSTNIVERSKASRNRHAIQEGYNWLEQNRQLEFDWEEWLWMATPQIKFGHELLSNKISRVRESFGKTSSTCHGRWSAG